MLGITGIIFSPRIKKTTILMTNLYANEKKHLK